MNINQSITHSTVRGVTIHLLRQLGVTKIFGNPGLDRIADVSRFS